MAAEMKNLCLDLKGIILSYLFSPRPIMTIDDKINEKEVNQWLDSFSLKEELVYEYGIRVLKISHICNSYYQLNHFIKINNQCTSKDVLKFPRLVLPNIRTRLRGKGLRVSYEDNLGDDLLLSSNSLKKFDSYFTKKFFQ